MTMNRIVMLVGALALLLGNGALFAQTSDSQTLTLVVAETFEIAGPVNVSQNYDGSSSTVAFDNNEWTATQNKVLGSTANFTITRFINTPAAAQRDAQITLSVTSSSNLLAPWIATVPVGVTSVATPTATVTAVSLGPSNGVFDIDVLFINADPGALPEGSYIATLMGTLTAN